MTRTTFTGTCQKWQAKKQQPRNRIALTINNITRNLNGRGIHSMNVELESKKNIAQMALSVFVYFWEWIWICRKKLLYKLLKLTSYFFIWWLSLLGTYFACTMCNKWNNKNLHIVYLCTSKCLVASSLRDISMSLVRILRKCMSLSRAARFTVHSFVDWGETDRHVQSQTQQCIFQYHNKRVNTIKHWPGQ